MSDIFSNAQLLDRLQEYGLDAIEARDMAIVLQTEIPQLNANTQVHFTPYHRIIIPVTADIHVRWSPTMPELRDKPGLKPVFQRLIGKYTGDKQAGRYYDYSMATTQYPTREYEMKLYGIQNRWKYGEQTVVPVTYIEYDDTLYIYKRN